MKKQILLSCALAWAVMAGAETIDITTFRYAGPYVVQAPFQVDSVDVNSKTFVSGRLLDTHLSVDVLQQGTNETIIKIMGKYICPSRRIGICLAHDGFCVGEYSLCHSQAED